MLCINYRFDSKHTDNEVTYLECFCVITSGIKENANGCRLKQMMIDKAILSDAIDYITLLAPPIKTLLAWVNLWHLILYLWMIGFPCFIVSYFELSSIGVFLGRMLRIGKSLSAVPVCPMFSVCSLVCHLCLLYCYHKIWARALVNVVFSLGLCSGHAPSQELVGETMIPIVHKLEHMSSNTQIGSLAENLMEVLCQNEKVSQQVSWHWRMVSWR